MENQEKTLASEYNDLKEKRESWISAAKEAAKYTLPSIINDDTTVTKSKNKSSIKSPNQSVGADGVNNLASKVTMTMLPPNQTFYRFKMDSAVIKAQAQGDSEEASKFEDEVNRGLATLESMLLDYMESSSDRVCLGEALKHLYIAGNVLLTYDDKLGLKYYSLPRYVVKRDYVGNVQKVITEEKVGFLDLPDYIQKQILAKDYKDIVADNPEDKARKLKEQEFVLYTGYRRDTKQWTVWQEVEGFKLEKSAGTYPKDIIPVIALRYVRVDGEDYGRGLIEEYFGDISYLDTICKAIKEASLVGAKLVMLVKPNAQTSIRKLAQAKNGDYVVGNPEDVTPLQANKYYDLQTAQSEADKIEKRLNRIFVMKAAIQRDAERVTAEEIRQMATDLEEALGNHYSLMAKEFQLNYVKLVYYHLKKKKRALDLPDILNNEDIKLTITTGLEALGKTSDLNKLITFFDLVAKIAPVGQQAGAKMELIFNRIAASMNLDITGLFYTEEEKAEIAQAQQQQAMMQGIMPNVVNKAGDMLMQQQGGEANG